jgi:hypothetical protein
MLTLLNHALDGPGRCCPISRREQIDKAYHTATRPSLSCSRGPVQFNTANLLHGLQKVKKDFTEWVTEFRVEASLSQCTALCKREFQRKLGCQGNSAKYTTFLLPLYSAAEPLQCERRWLFVRFIIIQSCSHCRIKWQKVSVKFQLPFQFQRKKLGVCAA